MSNRPAQPRGVALSVPDSDSENFKPKEVDAGVEISGGLPTPGDYFGAATRLAEMEKEYSLQEEEWNRFASARGVDRDHQQGRQREKEELINRHNYANHLRVAAQQSLREMRRRLLESTEPVVVELKDGDLVAVEEGVSDSGNSFIRVIGVYSKRDPRNSSKHLVGARQTFLPDLSNAPQSFRDQMCRAFVIRLDGSVDVGCRYDQIPKGDASWAL